MGECVCRPEDRLRYNSSGHCFETGFLTGLNLAGWARVDGPRNCRELPVSSSQHWDHRWPSPPLAI